MNTQRKFLEQKEKKLIPVCESFTKERFLKLNKSLEKTIIPPMENYTTNLLKWLEDGLDIHNLKSTDITEKGTCEFCGNEFITDEIINTIENKIDTEYSQLIRAIDKIISELPQKDITKLFTDELDSQVLLDFNNAIDFLRELLENKRYNTMSNLNFPTELIEKFLILDISILKKKQEYQFEIVSIDKKLNRLELYAKHLVGKNLEQNPKINELKYQIPELDHMTSISQKAIEGNEIKIKEWNEIDSDYSNFKDIVNQELDRLGLEFRLELLNNDLGYKIKGKLQVQVSHPDKPVSACCN
ncbi:putative mobile element (chromosomal cassette SCCmec type IVc) [Pseudolactococcus piscium]|nr:putative mobile element (chromosomal cassette SCCmec type IVc) [Lactococcus piscium]